jgi:thioredoxin-related protein
MKHVLIAVTILILASLSAGAGQKKSVPKNTAYIPVEKFDPKRDAAKDIQAAIKEAAKRNKRILLDVGGEWCIWCHRLDTLFMQNKELDEYLHKYFVVVKINVSKENLNAKLLANYPEIQGYPHLFVLEKDGKLLHSQNTGDLESGKRHDKEKVLAFLKNWTLESGGKAK